MSFNEPHIVAIAQAICLYRRQHGIDGPLFIGIDTHALSRPAFVTALEVFVANEVVTMIDADDGYTPTPVISHAILAYNRGRTERARRRRRPHSVAQSAGRRRLQVQPADRRPGRFGGDRLDRGGGEPVARKRGSRRQSRPV